MTPFLLAASLALGGQGAQSAIAAGGRHVESSPPARQQASTGAPTTIPEMWGAWCARCHADDGSGKVKEPTVTVVPMDLTDCRVASSEPDADWERAIAKGGPGVGLSSEMPAFEDSLTAAQISGFVSHMRGFCKEPGWPSGNNNFPRPLITAKAFPENEFLLIPVVSHETEPSSASTTDIGLTAIYERRLGRRATYEISVPVYNLDFVSARDTGLGDIGVGVKYTAFASSTAPRILSFGLEATLPTGEQYKEFGNGTVILEPSITAGTMVGKVYVQGEGKIELRTDTSLDRIWIYNAYVGADTSTAPTAWTFGVELNGANSDLAITPQVRKGLTGTGALAASFGVSIPIKYHGEKVVSWGGYLLWEFLEPLRARR